MSDIGMALLARLKEAAHGRHRPRPAVRPEPRRSIGYRAATMVGRRLPSLALGASSASTSSGA
jgi:hypothetical protein